MDIQAKTSTKSALQKELIDLMKKLIPLHSVYVIGVNKEKKNQNVYLSPQSLTTEKLYTYTLLIITHKPISKRLGDLMDDLYNKMQQRCKVYLITYTLSRVKKQLNYGDNFLSQVVFHTSCIYKADDSLSKFRNFGLHFHSYAYKGIQKTWKGRMDRAAYLLTILNNIEPEEDSTSKLAIMHYALEQVCMALLYVFWEFKPQHYSLSYLLHLCSHFTKIPQTIFPKETYGLHRMLYMLCNAQHIMRFKVKNEFTHADTDKAYNRCDRFYDEAKLLGDKHMEHLERLHCNASELKSTQILG